MNAVRDAGLACDLLEEAQGFFDAKDRLLAAYRTGVPPSQAVLRKLDDYREFRERLTAFLGDSQPKPRATGEGRP